MNRTVSKQDNISTTDNSAPLRKKPSRSPIRQQTSPTQVEDASFKDANQAKKPRETRRVSSSADQVQKIKIVDITLEQTRKNQEITALDLMIN